MLRKCANPACPARFLYLHEGRLFAVASKVDPQKQGPPGDPEYTGGSRTLEYFWLCSSCCCAITVQSDGDHGITLIPRRQTFLATEDRSPIAA